MTDRPMHANGCPCCGSTSIKTVTDTVQYLEWECHDCGFGWDSDDSIIGLTRRVNRVRTSHDRLHTRPGDQQVGCPACVSLNARLPRRG